MVAGWSKMVAKIKWEAKNGSQNQMGSQKW
jgi:hypothetical protein